MGVTDVGVYDVIEWEGLWGFFELLVYFIGFDDD